VQKIRHKIQNRATINPGAEHYYYYYIITVIFLTVLIIISFNDRQCIPVRY